MSLLDFLKTLPRSYWVMLTALFLGAFEVPPFNLRAWGFPVGQWISIGVWVLYCLSKGAKGSALLDQQFEEYCPTTAYDVYQPYMCHEEMSVSQQTGPLYQDPQTHQIDTHYEPICGSGTEVSTDRVQVIVYQSY